MSLKKISDYLKKFSVLAPPEETLKKNLIQTLERRIGVTLSPKDIHVQKKVVFVQASPIIKNEIFLQKHEILKEIIKINKKIKDIH